MSVPNELVTSLDSTSSMSSQDLDDFGVDQHELVDLGLPRNRDDDGEIASAGETVKVDKKFERDGEISDYELAASGYTKKEFTQDDHTIGLSSGTGTMRKKRIFLGENNPPAPVSGFVVDKEREHRSLDRNFERNDEYVGGLRYERNHSLDRDVRPSRKMKEPSYTLSRFIERDLIVEPAVELESVTSGDWPPVERPPTEVVVEAGKSLGPKVECVFSLLSMLGSHDSVEMSKKFLELSSSNETCAALSRSGCIPLLVQMMHSDTNDEVRKRASTALHNIIQCLPDDKAGRREAKVLRLIVQIMEYCNFLKSLLQCGGEAIADDSDRHPLSAISNLMKVSFDVEHRHAMCQLGALQPIASLFHLDRAAHGPRPEDQCCNSLRRFALMALTNLTFGDGNNKALLCANKDFMEALVAQLNSAPDHLIQVSANVLRNLSWRADNNMKAVLKEIGTVTALAQAAMKNKNEDERTLKAILSALWNVSAHCSTNRGEFCSVDGALAFLCDMLTYEGPSKTLQIIENAGGILRNISSHIAVREDYRQILRERNCLGILLQQLKSESLTVVSNACGTLWNLSARFPEDQKFLWDNGAVPMLRSLIHSKHKMIAEGSSAALKNLLNYRPVALTSTNIDPVTKSMGLKELPTLNARKQRALADVLDNNLAETCDNLDTVTPSKERNEVPKVSNMRLTRSAMVSKSDSRDSILSVKSDSVYEKLVRGRVQTANKTSDLPIEDPIDSEEPIDYSAKYSENAAKLEAASKPKAKPARNYLAYQETDLDQPTDFSLRYAENQAESDVDDKSQRNSSEIVLIMEDSVKCYQTEGTPYISNAASVSDLGGNSKPEEGKKSKKDTVVYGSGSHTPEKPTNYCEEGTPGYFSRYDSLSSLEEAPANETVVVAKAKTPPKEKVEVPKAATEKPAHVQSRINSAQETPLMFSRRSSMDSLVEEDEAEPTADDKSSVVSDFSRLASGIISPSDIPDSPTQSMPQSPRRNSSTQPPFPPASVPQRVPVGQRLRSVFADDCNTFEVENTPAQFSCATSLSNLSLDDEPKIATDSLDKEMILLDSPKDQSASLKAEQLEEENKNLLSEGEGEGDDYLLATCINMGMNRTAANVPATDDAVQQYFTEDTPALLSKVGSNSNLSVLSIATTNKGDTVNLSDVSSNASDCGLDLLAQCIRDGMAPKTAGTTKQPPGGESKSSDPIAMLRRGGLPPYLPVRDETNKFLVEDSPCNFSVISGLSNLTIESGVAAGPAKIKRLPPTSEEREQSSQLHQVADDSLSSISIESEDDTKLLSQAIAAGYNRPKSNLGFTPTTRALSSSQPIPTSSRQTSNRQQFDGNESFSSVDSSDSNDNHSKSLFEQCIRTGMHKKTPNADKQQHQHSNRPSVSNPNLNFSPKRSQLPLLANNPKTPVQMDRERQRERAKKDEQLLNECINTGMSKITISGAAKIKPPTRLVRQILAPNEFGQRFVTGGIDHQRSHSKNGVTTSVAVLDHQQLKERDTQSSSAPSTAPDVEMRESPDGTSNESKSPLNARRSHKRDRPLHIESNNSSNQQAVTGFELDSSCGSINLSSDVGILEQSNEYPALKMSQEVIEESEQAAESSFDMDVSNEFMIERDDEDTEHSALQDKHKDPDLMMKSVERLTLNFVATAELLRTAKSNSLGGESDSQEFDSNSTVYERKSSGTSLNTWNDNTCPNDVSFPSVSVTAPVLDEDRYKKISEQDEKEDDEIHDFAEVTPTNEMQPFEPVSLTYGSSQPNSLDTLVSEQSASQTTTQSGIQFQVGGEVKGLHFANPKSDPFLSSGPSSLHAMTNSIAIAMEANKLANNLRHMTDSTTSLDLDNIGPPSCMDSLSFSGCFDMPPLSQSPQLSRLRKKSLPAGIMARRALGGQLGIHGSVESVNSSCNLDNIKPPSLMDELLDSMISVASIQSEIVDGATHSNYETACSEIDLDDNTTIMQSCIEGLPSDGYDSCGTPIPSDFSSAESTPRKGPSGIKRTLTPKQKRRQTKDRYKTYTVAADFVLKENETEKSASASHYVEVDEVLKIEIEESPQLTPPVNRRSANPERFKTQTITFDVESIKSPKTKTNEFESLTSTEDDSEDMCSIRALTKQFKFITEPAVESAPRGALALATTQAESDYNSMECDQNSETESCAGNVGEELQKPRIVIPSDKDSGTDVNFSEDGMTTGEIEVKAVRGRKKPAYVSPYRKSAVSNNPISRLTAPKKVQPIGARTNLAEKQIPKNPVISKTHILTSRAGLTTRPATTTASAKKDSPKALQRQGTFVKDEPSNAEVPVVGSLPASPAKTSKLPTKMKTPKSPAKISQRTPTSNPKLSSSKIPQQPATAATTARPFSRTQFGLRKSTSALTANQRSNSNASIRTTPAVTALRTNLPSTTPPSRSNSNLTSNKLSQIGSRIAGIWKKIDEAKRKPTVGTTAKTPAPATKLIRSSTFDSSPSAGKSAKVTPAAAKKPPPGLVRRAKVETTGK